MRHQNIKYLGTALTSIVSLILGAVAVPWVWAQPKTQAPSVGFGLRMELLSSNTTTKALLNAAQIMRSDWIAQDVKWKDIESEPGYYNWSKLDNLLLTLRPYGIRLLVSISGTPDWARPAGSDLSLDGPPADYATFTRFLNTMGTRYAGVIAAYEIWPEANLRPHWGNAEGVSPEAYVEFVRQAAVTLHTADPVSVVISGGPAPTGTNDGSNVMDDLTFFQRMYAAGLKYAVDGLGVRVDGYNNPPTDTPTSSSVSTTTYKGHTSFYFRHYEDVYTIAVANGAADQKLWITSAGWASAKQPKPGQEYAADVTEQQQADYWVTALAQLQSQPYVAAIFVNNFNLSTLPATQQQFEAYSLIQADWSARPVFITLAQFRQGDAFSQPTIPNTGTEPSHVLPNWRPRLRYTFRPPAP